MVVSEMVSVEGLIRNAPNTDSLLAFEPMERPLGIQLFGGDPASFETSVKILADTIVPDFIDLNSGCPVPKVIKKNGGAALLRDAPRFAAIVRAMVKSSSIPISVKIRCGWHAGDYVDVEFAKIAESEGASAVVLHPRFRSQMFSGKADWNRIAVVKDALSIPVVGNGDIVTPHDAIAMHAQTNCDSIMIGRGILGHPWLFNQIKALRNNESPEPPNNAHKRGVALAHLKRHTELYSERSAIREWKKHAAWYIRGCPEAAILRGKAFSAHSLATLTEVMCKAFE